MSVVHVYGFSVTADVNAGRVLGSCLTVTVTFLLAGHLQKGYELSIGDGRADKGDW